MGRVQVRAVAMVQALIEAGADSSVTDSHGRSALTLALRLAPVASASAAVAAAGSTDGPTVRQPNGPIGEASDGFERESLLTTVVCALLDGGASPNEPSVLGSVGPTDPIDSWLEPPPPSGPSSASPGTTAVTPVGLPQNLTCRPCVPSQEPGRGGGTAVRPAPPPPPPRPPSLSGIGGMGGGMGGGGMGGGGGGVVAGVGAMTTPLHALCDRAIRHDEAECDGGKAGCAAASQPLLIVATRLLRAGANPELSDPRVCGGSPPLIFLHSVVTEAGVDRRPTCAALWELLSRSPRGNDVAATGGSGTMSR